MQDSFKARMKHNCGMSFWVVGNFVKESGKQEFQWQFPEICPCCGKLLGNPEKLVELERDYL